MSTQTVRLHRWDEIALEKVTEMISRKLVTGEREMLSQIYLKKGALVPNHSHESEQMTYVLQGALKFLIAGEEITVREGEVLHIPSWVEHQAEALDDTFELDLFSPIRQDWLDHTDHYFHRVDRYKAPAVVRRSSLEEPRHWYRFFEQRATDHGPQHILLSCGSRRVVRTTSEDTRADGSRTQR